MRVMWSIPLNIVSTQTEAFCSTEVFGVFQEQPYRKHATIVESGGDQGIGNRGKILLCREWLQLVHQIHVVEGIPVYCNHQGIQEQRWVQEAPNCIRNGEKVKSSHRSRSIHWKLHL